MTSTPPLSEPHKFIPPGGTAEAIGAQALVFIAQRLAGVEWVLGEINEKLHKIIATGQQQLIEQKQRR